MPDEFSVVNDVLVTLFEIHISWVVELDFDPHAEHLDDLTLIVRDGEDVVASLNVGTVLWVVWKVVGQMGFQRFIDILIDELSSPVSMRLILL
jgi:hypothetical protein